MPARSPGLSHNHSPCGSYQQLRWRPSTKGAKLRARLVGWRTRLAGTHNREGGSGRYTGSSAATMPRETWRSTCVLSQPPSLAVVYRIVLVSGPLHLTLFHFPTHTLACIPRVPTRQLSTHEHPTPITPTCFAPNLLRAQHCVMQSSSCTVNSPLFLHPLPLSLVQPTA